MLDFGSICNPNVLELVKSNFKDDTMIVVDEKSKEGSVDSESNCEIMVEHVEETIELDDLESGVNDNDSGDYSEGRGVVRVISGGLGTSPGVYADEYDGGEDELSEDQEIFNVLRGRPWGSVRYVERLGSDGEVSEFSLGTDDEDMTHVCGAPTHPNPNLY